MRTTMASPRATQAAPSRRQRCSSMASTERLLIRSHDCPASDRPSLLRFYRVAVRTPAPSSAAARTGARKRSLSGRRSKSSSRSSTGLGRWSRCASAVPPIAISSQSAACSRPRRIATLTSRRRASLRCHLSFTPLAVPGPYVAPCCVEGCTVKCESKASMLGAEQKLGTHMKKAHMADLKAKNKSGKMYECKTCPDNWGTDVLANFRDHERRTSHIEYAQIAQAQAQASSSSAAAAAAYPPPPPFIRIPPTNALFEEIRSKMRRKRLGFADAAKLVGVEESYWRCVLEGLRRPTRGEIAAIERELEVSVEVMLFVWYREL